MRELNLTQDPANDIGGGPATVRSTEERAAIAKERVMAVYRSGVAPTYEHFVSRSDGHTCACAIGSMALSLGSKLIGEKRMRMSRASEDVDARMAFVNQLCQATSDFSIAEVLALEEGYMNWDHGYFSGGQKGWESTVPFYEAGKQIAKEAFGRV